MSAVKCLYCNKYFDRDEEAYSKIGRRYAHYDCYQKHMDKPEDKDSIERRKLTDCIQMLYYPRVPDWRMIGTQIRKYRLEGFTYAGMRLTLEYFYKIKKNKLKPNQGIGIVPYVYQEAHQYYLRMDEMQQKRDEILEGKAISQPKTDIVVVTTPQKPKKKLMDFEY